MKESQRGFQLSATQTVDQLINFKKVQLDTLLHIQKGEAARVYLSWRCVVQTCRKRKNEEMRTTEKRKHEEKKWSASQEDVRGRWKNFILIRLKIV